jgi:hypothetical protein
LTGRPDRLLNDGLFANRIRRHHNAENGQPGDCTEHGTDRTCGGTDPGTSPDHPGCRHPGGSDDGSADGGTGTSRGGTSCYLRERVHEFSYWAGDVDTGLDTSDHVD